MHAEQMDPCAIAPCMPAFPCPGLRAGRDPANAWQQPAGAAGLAAVYTEAGKFFLYVVGDGRNLFFACTTLVSTAIFFFFTASKSEVKRTWLDGSYRMEGGVVCFPQFSPTTRGYQSAKRSAAPSAWLACLALAFVC